MRGGRARWKIENETFNTLKNQGYEFEHNYGHGHKNLSVNLAFLMMLAFLVDQSQLLTSKVVQLALQKNRSLSEFYRMIRSLFDVFLFENWLELYEALAYGFDSKITIKRRSNSSWSSKLKIVHLFLSVFSPKKNLYQHGFRQLTEDLNFICLSKPPKILAFKQKVCRELLQSRC